MSIFSMVSASLAPERTVLGERVQVDDHQVERLDAELLELLGVLGVGHISQNAGVNVRVQRLDAAVEAFGESGDIGHLGYLDA